jgi:hydroxymethylpyrimidine pyrophosphatase-like HAD family hydrolase
MSHGSATYVFDLDGVITDPADSSVNREVVGRIYDFLVGGGYIAVNTGRSYAWVGQNLISLLQKRNDASVFARLYVVCEKGGESMLWRDGGFVEQPSRFALDRKAYSAAQQTFASHKAELRAMFWDATKRTMATIEKEPSAQLRDFQKEQQHLVALLEQNTSEYEVKVDATTIATDVESPKAGKHAGAELIYEWALQRPEVNHDRFVCFGDSKSDYEMARYFASQGADTTFVFVGKATDNFSEDAKVKTIRTKTHYDQGALEYLMST